MCTGSWIPAQCLIECLIFAENASSLQLKMPHLCRLLSATGPYNQWLFCRGNLQHTATHCNKLQHTVLQMKPATHGILWMGLRHTVWHCTVWHDPLRSDTHESFRCLTRDSCTCVTRDSCTCITWHVKRAHVCDTKHPDMCVYVYVYCIWMFTYMYTYMIRCGCDYIYETYRNIYTHVYTNIIIYMYIHIYICTHTRI